MITLENVAVRSGQFWLRDISMEIADGQYGVLMGKTGCGKTTVLEAVCGLRTVVSGRILLHGSDVTSLKPSGRGLGYVPQDLALFPTLTVREHLAFALVLRHVAQAEIERRVTELSELLGIAPLLERKPHGLSGGEAQRVAIGRALSPAPKVLCLDEPLSALDEATRDEMVELLKRVQRESGVTVLHVTHNGHEAKKLADTLHVFESGKICFRGGVPII